jgi:hypothetical protein
VNKDTRMVLIRARHGGPDKIVSSALPFVTAIKKEVNKRENNRRNEVGEKILSFIFPTVFSIFTFEPCIFFMDIWICFLKISVLFLLYVHEQHCVLL